MIALVWFVLAVLASPFESKSRLEAENAVLRHQLIVLRRKVRGRAQLTNNDRWFFVQMYQWFLRSWRSRRLSSLKRSCVGIGRLLPLLALEIASTGRAAADCERAAWADPADEHREFALGCAAYPRRTAQT